MIAILLNDASFEQDIRELLMAFYPGETFTHKEEEAGADCAGSPGRKLVFTGCGAGEERSRSLCFDLSGFFQPF